MTEKQYKNLMFALSEMIYFLEEAHPYKELSHLSYDENLNRANQKRTRGTKEIFECLTGETTDKEAKYRDVYNNPQVKAFVGECGGRP